MCMPLSAFVPSVKKYVIDFSMSHADCLLCELTGKHFFPSKPLTTPALWKKVQDMDVQPKCLLLAYVENSQANHTLNICYGIVNVKAITSCMSCWV
jgi:hypothetical protein